MYFKFTTAPLYPTGDPYVKLDKCGYFDQARLDQRFEVVDEEIVSICSKFARSKLHVFLTQQDLTGSRARFLNSPITCFFRVNHFGESSLLAYFA